MKPNRGCLSLVRYSLVRFFCLRYDFHLLSIVAGRPPCSAALIFSRVRRTKPANFALEARHGPFAQQVFAVPSSRAASRRADGRLRPTSNSSKSARSRPPSYRRISLPAAIPASPRSTTSPSAAMPRRFAGITTSPAGTTISLMVDGAANGTYVIPLSGGSIFALEPTTPLADGAHVVQFLESHTHHFVGMLTIDVDTVRRRLPPPTSPSIPRRAPPRRPALLRRHRRTGRDGHLVFDEGHRGDRPGGRRRAYQFVMDPVPLAIRN